MFTARILSYYLCAAIVVTCAVWFNLRAYHAVRASASDAFVQEWDGQDFSKSFMCMRLASQCESDLQFLGYLGGDHPPTLLPPSRHPRNVALVTEETVHYRPYAPQDWESMAPAGSRGFVRLGPQKRLFGVSMYHQLHCLLRLQQAAADSSGSDVSGTLEGGEVHHCLNYLRQALLCAANVRLEPLRRNRTSGALSTNGIGLEHRCKDWTLVRREVKANFERWTEKERML